MKAKPNTLLYCFSPPVMLATIIIEVSLAAYSLYRFRMNRVAKIVTAMLVCLSIFQLAEFFVCTGRGFDSYTWSVIGYIAITLLPPLGMHLVSSLAEDKYRAWVVLGYTASALIVSYLVLSPSASQAVCNGNYVIFSLRGWLSIAYGTFYHGVILLGLLAAIRSWHSGNRARREALRWYVLGVLSFLAPVAVVLTLVPHAANGIPSIMCGFAVVFGVIIGLKILPLTGLRRSG